jgi:hypothetical protein
MRSTSSRRHQIAANHSVNGNFTVTILEVKSDSPSGQSFSSEPNRVVRVTSL